MGQCAEGARHGRGIDHGQHGHAKALGQVGRARVAVEQAHHALDEEQVGLERGVVQALGAVGRAIDPQVQRVHRRAAGQFMPVRVEKIRPALEHAHAPPLPRVQPRQRGRHRGLALARGRGGHQQGGAGGRGSHGHSAYCGAHFRPT
jgi:hypothetical protein